jgi:hypothetical protein
LSGHGIRYYLRLLKNLTVSATLRKRMGFYEVTGGRALFFRTVSMGEAAAPSRSAPSSRPRGLSRGMRRGQNSPVDMLLKKPAREPRPPAHRAYAPEGTEEKPILDTKIWVM